MATGVSGCGGGCGGISMVPRRDVLAPLSPAQAAALAQERGTYGDWVRDVPVEGPTDEGIRRAGCWWKDHVLSRATDCEGRTVPASTQSSVLCRGGLPFSGISGVETVRRGGRVVGALGQPAAPAAAAPGGGTAPTTTAAPAPAPAPTASAPATAASAPPGLWAKLSSAEAHWVAATLVTLNALIIKAGNKPCATWPADLLASDATATAKLPAAVACFQGWANTNLQPPKLLRLDGVLDEPTLCALVETTRRHSPDFPDKYPGSTLMICGWNGLPVYAKIGAGVGAAAVIGGTIWAISRGSKGKKPAAEPAVAMRASRR